jgi:hypothetical protein
MVPVKLMVPPPEAAKAPPEAKTDKRVASDSFFIDVPN